jgi:hypothetical protein
MEKMRFQAPKLLALTMVATLGSSTTLFGATVAAVDPAKMPRVGTIDERYQSFNIEMVEGTGVSSVRQEGRAARDGDTWTWLVR